MLLDQIIEPCLGLLRLKHSVAGREEDLMEMPIEDDVGIVDDGIDEAAKDLALDETLIGAELSGHAQLIAHIFEFLLNPVDEGGKQEVSLVLVDEIFLDKADRCVPPDVLIDALHLK